MNIKVLFFGVLHDVLGIDEMNFSLENATTIDSFTSKLLKTYPELKKYGFSVAVNEVYSKPDFILQDGHVVALIPPVSGG